MPAVTVVLGLAVAILADRLSPRARTLSKTIIFLPMAISMVGAAMIWRFIYDAGPAGQPQIGLQNAIIGLFGMDPVAWLAAEPVPPQQPVADGGAALVAGRVLDGAALGRRQGRAGRHPRGGPHRRRQRAADLLPGRGPADQGHDHHRLHHRHHRRDEDLRHRLRDDQRQLQHQRDRQRVLQPADHQLQQRRRRGDRRDADARGDPDHDLPGAALQGRGGRTHDRLTATTAAAAPPRPAARQKAGGGHATPTRPRPAG